MIFLVPAITEKALAIINAKATGRCGPVYENEPCQFTLVRVHLDYGYWTSIPTQSGTVVTWSTAGKPPLGDEEGSVTYSVGDINHVAKLYFSNPTGRSNHCGVVIEKGQEDLSGTCRAGIGYIATFTYTLLVR